jgi:hypothetical protein
MRGAGAVLLLMEKKIQNKQSKQQSKQTTGVCLREHHAFSFSNHNIHGAGGVGIQVVASEQIDRVFPGFFFFFFFFFFGTNSAIEECFF